MRSRLLIILALAIFIVIPAEGITPKAVKGVMDLRHLEKGERFFVNLNGEWEFYWNKMLHPYDFEERELIPDYYGEVPSYWTDYPSEYVVTQKEGFATYRLLVILPSGYRLPLGFDMPVFDSSYDVYVDGQYKAGNGQPGMSEEDTEPGYSRNFFRFDPQSDTISIVINVANFSHRRGGFWRPMKIGTFFEVQRRLANSWAGDWAIISLLLGFSLFFFFFYIISPREKVMGFFCMATIGLALRPLVTSHFLLSNLFDVSWTWIIRYEYLGLYLIVIGWTWFALVLYPTKYFRIFAYLTTTFFTIAAILTLFLPVKIFSYATQVLYPVIILLMVYGLAKSFVGTLKKRTFDLIYFLTFILLVSAAGHDIRVSLGKAESTQGYILSYAIAVFVLVQAGLLIYKWIKSYRENEKLQQELAFMNRNLEQLVTERTQELKTRNEEIEKQNTRIALQNKQLSQTLKIKNKIFSVVAHDLRSPVVNILYMLNLLKEKEYKEKYDTFANSSIEYAQRVISLLENMLVWGRDQEDKIKYSPARHNFADIILTNLSIFKESADKKEISVNFTQVGNSFAYFDKDLMDIIIRNLLSNAVKYTHRGGRISILLKEKPDEKTILLKICDNGVGIPEEKQESLFTTSDVSSTPGTENEKGTGLGLKLCYELIQINKGTISIESKEGEGTCFILNLPV